MKFARALYASGYNWSLPVWGEWIEIPFANAIAFAKKSLSPCGESGLKSFGIMRRTNSEMSLPVWGEWIEINSCARIIKINNRVSPRVGRVD